MDVQTAGRYTRLNMEPFREWYEKRVDLIRRRCAQNPEIMGVWPGNPEGSSAVSRYPNLAEEMIIPSPFVGLACVAEAARVRPKTIAAAIEQGRSLQPYQLERIAAALHVSVEYLADPCLAVVDPETKTGAVQAARLIALFEETQGLIIPSTKYVRSVYKIQGRGDKLPYAQYKFSIRALMSAKRHPLRQKKNRTPGPVVYTLPGGKEMQA